MQESENIRMSTYDRDVERKAEELCATRAATIIANTDNISELTIELVKLFKGRPETLAIRAIQAARTICWGLENE